MTNNPFSTKEQLLNHFSLEIYSEKNNKNIIIQYPYGSNFLTGLNPLWIFEVIIKHGISSGPYMVYFDATNKCKDNCPMCFLAKNRKATGIENEININNAFIFLDELLELSPFLKSAVIGGPGEPMEYTHLYEILNYFKQKNLTVHIYSSGYEIKNQISLILNTVKLFRISLDASSKLTYKLTHGKDEFEKKIHNIKLLISHREKIKSKTIIGLHYVIQKNNIDEILLFAELSKKLKVDYIEYVWESYYSVNEITDIQYKTAINYLKKAKELSNNNFYIISPNERKKHILKDEKYTMMSSEKVESHCYDLTGRLNMSVGGIVSLCAKERFNSQSEFNIGDFTKQTAIDLNKYLMLR